GRELRQALEDAEEHFLGQILGQRPVAVDEPEDVVEDRSLVRPQDQCEGALVSALGFAEDSGIRLCQAQGSPSIDRKTVRCRDFHPSSVKVSKDSGKKWRSAPGPSARPPRADLQRDP